MRASTYMCMRVGKIRMKFAGDLSNKNQNTLSMFLLERRVYVKMHSLKAILQSRAHMVC